MKRVINSGVVAAVVVAIAALFSANVFAQDKSADELVSLLKARFGRQWEIPATLPEKVIACEQRARKVMIFRTNSDWNDPDNQLWVWDPAESLTQEQARWFDAVDECKPVMGGEAILVNASGGGAALIRLSDKKLLFLGKPGGNTHSIAMFPDGNIVTASSTGKYLALFAVPADASARDSIEATPIAKKFELPDAHGVIWDAKRRLLWALGGEYLLGFEYVGTKENPDLKEVFRHKLEGAEANGHDLYPAPGYDALMTTGNGICVFDPEKRVFTTISNKRGIKSISLSPEGAILVQKAVEEWWTDTITFADDKESPVGKLDGAKFYKARWFLPNTFTEPQEK